MPTTSSDASASLPSSSPASSAPASSASSAVGQRQVVGPRAGLLLALAGGAAGQRAGDACSSDRASGRWKSFAACSCPGEGSSRRGPRHAALGRTPPPRRRPARGNHTACRSDAERAAFADTLARAAAGPDGRAVVVVALRADFYWRFAAYPRLAEVLGGNQVLVGPMQASELRRAVELPAGRVGLRIEPGWPTRSSMTWRAPRARCRCCPPLCSSFGRSGRTTPSPLPPTGVGRRSWCRRAAG